MLRYKFHLLLVILSSVIVGYYYYPSLNNYFIWDDYWFLMTSSGNVQSVVFGSPTLRLTGNVIMWLNYVALGWNHVGYNVVSIAVHFVNIIILFICLKKITDDEKLSFIVSILYAAMSVYCDAILYKAALLTLTNLTFYLVALLLYVKGKENSKFYYWSLVVFFIGMFNKEEIASLPILIFFMELVLYDNFKNIKQVIKKTATYGMIVVVYVSASLILTKLNFFYMEQFERLSKFRPLHSLSGGFTSFFANPDGFLDNRYTLIRWLILLAVIPVALYCNRNRKMFLFGLGWIFITFLPQSYSSTTQYSPKYFFASISRHLYIPSVGAAIVVAVILLFTFKAAHRNKVNVAVAAFLCLLLFYNAPQVHERSRQWGDRRDADEMRIFLATLKAYYPVLDDGAHIIVDNPPTGRAYMTRALSAFYQRDVFFVDDPSTLDISKVSSLYEVNNYLHFGFLKAKRIK